MVEIAGSVIMPANTYLNPATTTANKSTPTATTKNTNATTQSTINAVGNSTTILKFASKTFPVIYQITGNGNKLKNISVAKDNTHTDNKSCFAIKWKIDNPTPKKSNRF